ncbi:glycosyltransferase [Flavobacterium sp.]|uniref:glycosyltransferase n=1 Tax=Flavobacterium sp. TaxID=239 RepID=UPI00375266DE
MNKIYIDPSSRILYSSYYIKGLYELFGKENVLFSKKYFKDLCRGKDDFSFEHFFAFVHINSIGKTTKFVIDFCDPYDIHKPAYNWCDLYAKINWNPELAGNDFDKKIVLIPPSFGVKIWSLSKTIFFSLKNYFLYNSILLTSTKKHFKDYYDQYKRSYIDDYENSNKDYLENLTPYIFMIGTLWDDENSMEFTNSKRKEFAEICLKKECDFEGGFYSKNYFNKDYAKLIFNKLYTSKKYIINTKLSQFVFNTPAVHNCHGWKLAEFFAMNKPIISTPLINKIHCELLHGKNIHFVSDKKELEIAIDLLLNNNKYCKELSNNIKHFYEEKCSPKAVIQSLMASVLN